MSLDRKGLPANIETEKLVLGSILVDDTGYIPTARLLRADDFAIESHRRIWRGMEALAGRNEKIDRVTVAGELIRHGQLESVGGISYLTSLDDSMPPLANLDSYVRIVKEQAERRRLIFAAHKLIEAAMLGESTAAELAGQANNDLLSFSEVGERSKMERVPEIVSAMEGGINALAGRSKRKRGLRTGFAELDQMTGGMREGELIVIAARPSMGKTALAMNISDQLALGRHRAAVAVCSFEMSKESLVTRLLCGRARVDLARQREGTLSSEERKRMLDAYREYEDSRLWMDYMPGATMLDIHSKLRRLKAKNGLDLAIIDYLQLISAYKAAQNRNIEVGDNTRHAKLMAGELGIPLILLSQLSRACEQRPGDHRPQMMDLRDSGSIEQDADLVGFIFREEVYKPDREDLRGLAELIVRKQRNGPIGTVGMVFLKEYTRFEDKYKGSETEQ